MPVIAIGGVTVKRVPEVIAAGAAGVAVITRDPGARTTRERPLKRCGMRCPPRGRSREHNAERKPHTLNGERSIPALLESLDAKPEQVAVAINGVVVARRDWPQTTVNDGDIVEVVRAVGGGSR